MQVIWSPPSVSVISSVTENEQREAKTRTAKKAAPGPTTEYQLVLPPQSPRGQAAASESAPLISPRETVPSLRSAVETPHDYRCKPVVTHNGIKANNRIVVFRLVSQKRAKINTHTHHAALRAFKQKMCCRIDVALCPGMDHDPCFGAV